MTLFIILAAAATASSSTNPVGQIAEQFGVDWWKFLSQCISFSIVAFILHKYAYQPVLNVLEERRKRIADGLANAEESKKQLASTQQQTAEILAHAKAESQRIIEEARSLAKSVGERETQRAVAEAEQIIVKAREATQMEHQKMLADLRKEVARLVITTAGRVTGKVLTDRDQKRLADEAAKEISA
jgi:F-type H+-transporting ATPase subunit b